MFVHLRKLAVVTVVLLSPMLANAGEFSFSIEGVVDEVVIFDEEAPSENKFGLEMGDTILIKGLFDSSTIIQMDLEGEVLWRILFPKDGENSYEIQAGTTTFTEQDGRFAPPNYLEYFPSRPVGEQLRWAGLYSTQWAEIDPLRDGVFFGVDNSSDYANTPLEDVSTDWYLDDLQPWTTRVRGHLNVESFHVTAVTATAEIVLADGNVHECSAYGSASVEASVEAYTAPDDGVVLIEWFLDGTSISTGETITAMVPLQNHILSANVTTVSGGSASDSVIVRVEDTKPPILSAKFLDSKGIEISEISRGGLHFVTTWYEATDECDPDPLIQGLGGVSLRNQSTLLIQASQEYIALNGSELRVFVIGVDESGNQSEVEVVLPIID